MTAVQPVYIECPNCQALADELDLEARERSTGDYRYRCASCGQWSMDYDWSDFHPGVDASEGIQP